MKSIALLFLLVVTLSGCVTKPVEVPSVTIPGASPETVRAALIERGVAKGWKIDKESQSEVVFGKPATSFAMMLAYGSNYDREPRVRRHFTLTASDGGTRLFLVSEIVTNPGSGFERITEDNNSKDVAANRQVLEELRVQLSK